MIRPDGTPDPYSDDQAERLLTLLERAGNSGRQEFGEKRLLGWLLGIVSALGCAGIIGDVVMYGQVKAQQVQLANLETEISYLRMEIDALLERGHADQSK